MTAELVLATPEDLSDLQTYAVRAKAIDPGGAMRLVATGTTLAAYVGVRPGQGLLGDGTIVGLRVIALGVPADVDVTVLLSAITDRTSRAQDRPALAVPPVSVTVSWAAQTPPRSGWAPDPGAPDTDLAAAARALGFVRVGEQPAHLVSGRWHRLSTPAGHVLMR